MTEAEKLAALDQQYRESPNALSLHLFNSALHDLYRANQLVLIGPDAVEKVARAIYQAMNGHIATAHTWEQLEPEPKAFWRDKATAALAALGVKP